MPTLKYIVVPNAEKGATLHRRTSIGLQRSHMRKVITILTDLHLGVHFMDKEKLEQLIETIEQLSERLSTVGVEEKEEEPSKEDCERCIKILRKALYETALEMTRYIDDLERRVKNIESFIQEVDEEANDEYTMCIKRNGIPLTKESIITIVRDKQ
jgi:hypothetical protein